MPSVPSGVSSRPSPSRTVDISTTSFISAAAIVFGAWLLWVIRDVVVIVTFTIILSAALHPSISWLERRGIPRPAGVLSLYVVLLGLATIIILTFAPVVSDQIPQLVVALAHVATRIVHSVGAQSDIGAAIANSISGVVSSAGTNAYRSVQIISNGGFVAILGGLLVYFLTVEHGSFRRFLSSLLPAQFRPALLDIGDTVEQRLSLWLRGQLTLGLIIGVMSYIALYVLHVPYAFVLALIAGMTELIPMIGPYLGMLPAAVIGFTVSPLTGTLVIASYFVIQQLENNFIVPKIVSQAVGLSPVVVFLALLVGAHVAGMVGIILAVPGAILIESSITLVRTILSLKSKSAVHV